MTASSVLKTVYQEGYLSAFSTLVKSAKST